MKAAQQKSRLKTDGFVGVLMSSDRSLFFGHEWQQTDEAGSKHSRADRSLIKSRRSGSTARQNPSFAVDQSSQSLQILVVHINRTRN